LCLAHLAVGIKEDNGSRWIFRKVRQAALQSEAFSAALAIGALGDVSAAGSGDLGRVVGAIIRTTTTRAASGSVGTSVCKVCPGRGLRYGRGSGCEACRFNF